MGYACYEKDGRDQGYGVPATCDHPDCDTEIHRGIAYACGGDPMSACGLFFCGEHMNHRAEVEGRETYVCERCADEDPEPFDPSPDVQEWIDWKLTDESWAQWRKENPKWVAANKETK